MPCKARGSMVNHHLSKQEALDGKITPPLRRRRVRDLGERLGHVQLVGANSLIPSPLSF